ncbi:sigma factor [Streptomyces sp. A1547]|uniref:RNA polymerase sigma factor n=1 Tax=Streptomyces sp. A1547 TaxID=2563105 RepID=UPI001F104C77|nr:sigma factor [Streptomyces sp. A1547]
MDFEAFVLETSAVFSRVARAEAGDLHSAEDAVQVAYLRMFSSWEKLSARQGSLVAYGRTAVKNAVIDQFRRSQRLVPVPVQEIPEQESVTGIPDAPMRWSKRESMN